MFLLLFGLIALGLSLAVFSVAAIGMARGPRPMGLIALVPAFNALLGFLLYRDRNLLPGVCALGILFGVGMATWQKNGEGILLSRAARTSIACLMVAAFGYQALQTRALVSREVAVLLADDPCHAVLIERDIGKRFAPIVKRRYGMSNPTCEAGR